MRAIQITEFGGPEVLIPTELPAPEPVPGMLLVSVDAAGVNFADTHQTDDSYVTPQSLPFVPGTEVVGTTEEGRRVTGMVKNGGYAEQVLVQEATAFDVPDGVEDGEALALLVQGLTAWHLLRTGAVLREGESVLVHAAAGGVGSLAVQLARRWGAGLVVGVASTGEKRELVLDLGADVAVDPATDDLGGAIEAAVGGPVDVVLDMVGGPTTDVSLAALAPFGRLVHFGQASRTPPSPVHPGALIGGSKTIAGFYLGHCFMDPVRMIGPPMAELQRLVADGELRVVVHPPYPLEEARRAHEDLRARQTTGKVVLTT